MLKEAKHLPDDYWPTRAEIVAVYMGRSNTDYTFDSVFKRSSWGEVYIINRVGGPAYAYLSNAVGNLPEGCLLTSQDAEWAHNPTVQRTGASRNASETNQEPPVAGSRR